MKWECSRYPASHKRVWHFAMFGSYNCGAKGKDLKLVIIKKIEKWSRRKIHPRVSNPPILPHISLMMSLETPSILASCKHTTSGLCTWGEPIPPHSTKRKLKVYVLISITWPSSAWCAAPFVSSFLARLDLSLGLGWYLDRTPGAKSSRGTTPSIPCSVNCQNENP